MMIRNGHIAVLAAILMLLVSLASCRREEAVKDGCITISFSTGAFETKAGDGVVADGGGIAIDAGVPNIVVALVDKLDNIIAWYPSYFPDTDPSDPFTSELIGDPSSTQNTIQISGPGRGTYTVYAVANYTGLSASALAALKAATEKDDLEAIELVVSGTPAVPTFLNSRMPISAKGTLSVNVSGNGQVDLDLLRPVSLVELYFIDQTDGDDPLVLYDCSVTIYEMNPTSGYLFVRDPDKGSGSFDDLEFEGSNLTLSTAPTTPTLGGTMVFPSTAPAQSLGNRYLCDISFNVKKSGAVAYDSGDSETYNAYSYTGLPIHDYRSTDLQYLRRNQRLKVSTRITKRGSEHDVSFWFEVASWEERTETVEFN